MANLSDKIAPIGVLTPSSSITDLSDVYSSMAPTDGQVLTYDTTNGWQAETAGALFGTVQTLTTDTTLTSADDRNFLSCSGGIALTLPALSAGLVFGISNTGGGQVVVSTPVSTTPVGAFTGGALLSAYDEAIFICTGSSWEIVGGSEQANVVVTQFSASGTYVPATDAKMFMVCAVGATGGTRSPYSSNAVGGSGGAGYSEKLYTAPFSASYTVTLGAGGVTGGNGGTTTFDTISISGSGGQNNAVAGGAGGVGSGGDFNATGGNGGSTSTAYDGGGGGGSATRAGNGGAGGAGTSSGGGAGGGTGGNAASTTTPGVAATAASASATDFPTFTTEADTFAAGGTGLTTRGGWGASSLNTVNIVQSDSITIGSSSSGRGQPGKASGVSQTVVYDGDPGHITILEFF